MQCCYPVAWNSTEGYNNVVTEAMRASYLHEVKEVVEQHMSSPSLVAYILFNEVCMADPAMLLLNDMQFF